MAQIDDEGASLIHDLSEIQPVLRLAQGQAGHRIERDKERTPQRRTCFGHLVLDPLKALEALVDERVSHPLKTAAAKHAIREELVEEGDRQPIGNQDHHR
jgi:hypothetical protein